MGKKQKTQKLSAKQKIFRAMAIPLNGVRLCVSDNIKAEIEGCTGIIIYDENEVKLSAGRLILRFVGSSLQITQYDNKLTVIEGFISSVSYERG